MCLFAVEMLKTNPTFEAAQQTVQQMTESDVIDTVNKCLVSESDQVDILSEKNCCGSVPNCFHFLRLVPLCGSYLPVSVSFSLTYLSSLYTGSASGRPSGSDSFPEESTARDIQTDPTPSRIAVRVSLLR